MHLDGYSLWGGSRFFAVCCIFHKMCTPLNWGTTLKAVYNATLESRVRTRTFQHFQEQSFRGLAWNFIPEWKDIKPALFLHLALMQQGRTAVARSLHLSLALYVGSRRGHFAHAQRHTGRRMLFPPQIRLLTCATSTTFR